MIRYIFLAAVIVALAAPWWTDALVDWQLAAQHADQNIGYSQDDRDMLDALAERATREEKRRRVLSGSDEAAAVRYLYGDGQ